MRGSSSLSMLLTVVHVLGTVASLAMGVALLATALGLVRRHRPDAWQHLAAAAAVHVGWIVFSSAAHVVLPMAASSGGIETILGLQAALSMLGTLVGIAWIGLLIVGISRLAQPPRQEAPQGAPPYR